MRKFFLALLVGILLIPTLRVNAITLGEYENKLAQYKSELAANQSAQNKTSGQIASTNNEINNLKDELLKLSKELESLNEEIDKYNVEIKDKIKQSKELIEYLEVSGMSNMFLEYLFDADSVTDLLYRSVTVNELIDYNNKTIEDLNKLIADNKAREKEIANRKVEIAKLEESLNKKVVELNNTKTTLSAGAVTIEKELKYYEEKVKYYKKVGCKSSDVIGVHCAQNVSTYGFRRPTTTGYVTQNASSSHRGIDVGSRNGTREKIYPVGDGTIDEVYKDYYGALCVRITHYNAKDSKWYTSIYCHMSSYAPNLYNGKRITSDQYIGYMGNTGYSFGNHLHLEVMPCRYGIDNQCFSWNNYVAFAKRTIANGYSYQKLLGLPTGLYNSWSSR